MITVAICTHNRANELKITFDSLSRLAPPAQDWELLVIDNASTDLTQTVLADEIKLCRLPLRLGMERRLGLSIARNFALQEAAGEAIIFLDDDVDASPHLLTAYEGALREYPNAGYFGGPIRPVLADPTDPLAAAILASFPDVFSCVDLGRDSVIEEPGKAPYGANLCVRTSAISGVKFDSAISYVGRGGIVGDETDFILRLHALGITGRWVQDAAVGHRIPVSRSSWPFIEKSAGAVGRSAVLMEHQSGSLPQPTLRLVLWHLRRAMASLARAALISDRALLVEQVTARYRASEHQAAAREVWRLYLRNYIGLLDPAE